MSCRRIPLTTGEVYHIFTKSIAGFEIFRSKAEFIRMIEAMRYYQAARPAQRFSWFLKDNNKVKKDSSHNNFVSNDKVVQIVAYCLMPTHLHLILKQLKDEGISFFMNNLLNSYSHYFNIKNKRKGPLWESRFRSVLVEADEQLLHLTRYIHLNPATAFLVNKAENWEFSSYREYITEIKPEEKICGYRDILDTQLLNYKDFVETRLNYQRELAKIKDLLLE